MNLQSLLALATSHLLTALLALSCADAGAAGEQFIPRDMRLCSAEHAAAGYELPCKQPLSADAVATELDKLKTKNFAYEVKGDTLFVTARMAPGEVTYPNGPFLCCDIQAYLDRIADDVYSASFL